MPTGDTIAALASPPGRSARAIVRLSGPAARTIANDLAPAARARTPLVGRLTLPAAPARPELRLPVLFTRFPAPRSYTGEETLEIQFTGHPDLPERVLSALCAHPEVRPAGPGEFTARAYLAGRLTLDQAEGIAAAIRAESDDDLAAADRVLSGDLGGRYRAWADELATLLALTEAGIDFTDQEDVQPIAPADLTDRLRTLTCQIATALGDRAPREARGARPLVVLAGAPSAGKSTLFNALLGQRRAATDAAPGTTRDVLTEPLDLRADLPGAGIVDLADAPGLDTRAADALGPSDAEAQQQAHDAIRLADLILWCDPTGAFESAGKSLADLPFRAGNRAITTLRVRTKADLGDPRLGGSDPAAPPSLPRIDVCALDGFNLRTLRRAIAEQAGAAGARGLAAVLPRHAGALERALDDTKASIRAAAPAARGARALPAEIVASHLRDALNALGELVGHISPDDVIGRVFATFCVGK